MVLPYIDAIQQLVDSLAARIQRSVAVDDQRGGLVVSSRHFGDEDQLRIDVVLSRRLPARVAEYLNGFGIAAAEEPLSIPGSPSLGLKARRCYPIRDHGRLLGYLWLIDDGAERFDEVVGECVVQLSERLRERSLQVAGEERRRRALVAGLLRGGEGSARAADDLVGQGLVGAEDRIVVVAADATTDPVAVATSVAQATDRRGRDEPGVRAFATVLGDRGVVLVSGRDELASAAASLAEEVRQDVVGRDTEGRGTFLGLSDTGRLEQAPDLLRQAVLAAFAAAELPELAPVLSWRDTGVYGPLMLAATASPDLVVPPEIVGLSSGGRTDSLAHTAEVFLDAAGDTATASEQLMIHRTTLYYRLAQVENKTGWDLKNGRDRLTLHLGLKMQRLLGSGIPALLRGEEERRGSS
ncbi:CdaR family transcriptional regulator [Streptomyces sp. MUM 16J]|uniref:PucR family transcriptional regulator n=1 Tax=Streptomyces sp. MUM 16J TaxID=2791988 RepID=UPI001F04A59E|nr:helix-turn-helix domain-containing protein [Streptomyces sp. MUM 16J]MCH0558193.1 helix-turn-helix domain-containing protein [Streptomyces sp. MUM 16J]